MTIRERRIKRHKEIMAQRFENLGYLCTLSDNRYFRFYGKHPSQDVFDQITLFAYLQVMQEENDYFDITELLV